MHFALLSSGVDHVTSGCEKNKTKKNIDILSKWEEKNEFFIEKRMKFFHNENILNDKEKFMYFQANVRIRLNWKHLL